MGKFTQHDTNYYIIGIGFPLIKFIISAQIIIMDK